MKVSFVFLLLLSTLPRAYAGCTHLYQRTVKEYLQAVNVGVLIKQADPSCKLWSWKIKNRDGKTSSFVLNAPDEEDHFFQANPPQEIRLLGFEDIKKITKNVGENRIFDIVSFLEVMYKSWGDLDYASRSQNTVVIDGVFYGSDFDFGNFLWGYSAAKLGMSLKVAQGGAQLNALLIDDRHTWDGIGDQRAIKNGHKYFRKHMTKKQATRLIFDNVIF